ncbi:MAG TPA: hypothetical protein DC042_05270, partial [Bacteroidales bacterium]|nr:hypothetical protein [Bacteroidales bacterium]
MKNRPMIRPMPLLAILYLLLLISSCSQDQPLNLSVTCLRCEYRIDPQGIDALHPRLSWVMESADQEQGQTSWQIVVA